MSKSALQITTTDPVTLPKQSKSKIDIRKVLNLRDSHGLSFADIGRQLNVSRQAVNQAYKQFTALFPDYQQTELYISNKSNYLQQAEFVLLQDLLDEDRRAKASLNNTGYVWDKVYNNNRVQQGQGTAGSTTVTIQLAFQQAEIEAKQALAGHHVVDVSVNNEDQD